ncbi:MAG: glycosyltransferase [Cyclobacteriaceae bacterium]
MRILLSAYACTPNKGSEPGIGWNWAVTLAEQGHQVHCLTSKKHQESIIQAIHAHEQSTPNLKFHIIKVWAWLEFLKNLFPYPLIYLHYLVWQYEAYQYALRLQQDIAFDLTHHVTYGSIQMGSRLWKLDIPFVFGPIGGGENIPAPLKKYLSFGWFKETCRNLAAYLLLHVFKNARLCLKHASAVLVTNSDTYALAASLGATNIRYFLDMGIKDVTPPLERKSLADGQLKLLWVGKLVTTKGLDMVLESLYIADNPNISLTIVGNGPLRYYYQIKAYRLGLSRQVHFKGFLSYPNLKKLYASHDALVFSPLRSAFGGQLLEAMSFGLPIITLDLHGAGFFVPEGAGIKLKLTSSKEIKQAMGGAINSMSSNPGLCEMMSINAYEFAKAHEWRWKADEMAGIYDEVLSHQLTSSAINAKI